MSLVFSAVVAPTRVPAASNRTDAARRRTCPAYLATLKTFGTPTNTCERAPWRPCSTIHIDGIGHSSVSRIRHTCTCLSTAGSSLSRPPPLPGDNSCPRRRPHHPLAPVPNDTAAAGGLGSRWETQRRESMAWTKATAWATGLLVPHSRRPPPPAATSLCVPTTPLCPLSTCTPPQSTQQRSNRDASLSIHWHAELYLDALLAG